MAPRRLCLCQKCTLGGLIPEGRLVCASTYRNHEKGIGVVRKAHRLPANNGQEIIHCHCALCTLHFGQTGRPFTNSGLLRHLRRNQERINCSTMRTNLAAAAAAAPVSLKKVAIEDQSRDQSALPVVIKLGNQRRSSSNGVVVDDGPESSCGSN